MAIKKILFLGHDASRTGAPLLLLQLIAWLESNSEYQTELLLKSGGPLEQDYSKQIPTAIWSEKIRQYNFSFMRAWLRRARVAAWREPDWEKIYPLDQYPLVYANTVLTLPEALKFASPGRKIILHVHELAQIVNEHKLANLLEQFSAEVNIFIAVSKAVREFLVDDLKIPEQKIRLVHEHAIFRSEVEIQRSVVRKSYGLQVEDFAIGMCGSTGWRKGTDLFFRLAQIIKKRDQSNKIKLLWLGGSEIAHAEAMHDAVRLGISEVLRFYPQSEDTSGFFNALDVFALTSREDPFPVAMLEAAAAGVPIICFNQSGGGPEFVANDAGICVPYANVGKMADACILFCGDNDLRVRLGRRAMQKVELEYTLQSQAPKLLEIIQELI